MADADLKVSVWTLHADVADMKFDSQWGYEAPIESDKARGGYYYSEKEYPLIGCY